jgi:hypothetical protein
VKGDSSNVARQADNIHQSHHPTKMVEHRDEDSHQREQSQPVRPSRCLKLLSEAAAAGDVDPDDVTDAAVAYLKDNGWIKKPRKERRPKQ